MCPGTPVYWRSWSRWYQCHGPVCLTVVVRVACLYDGTVGTISLLVRKLKDSSTLWSSNLTLSGVRSSIEIQVADGRFFWLSYCAWLKQDLLSLFLCWILKIVDPFCCLGDMKGPCKLLRSIYLIQFSSMNDGPLQYRVGQLLVDKAGSDQSSFWANKAEPTIAAA